MLRAAAGSSLLLQVKLWRSYPPAILREQSYVATFWISEKAGGHRPLNLRIVLPLAVPAAA
jgi:hypothetical protein